LVRKPGRQAASEKVQKQPDNVTEKFHKAGTKLDDVAFSTKLFALKGTR
jgi:hypothetical protein